MAYEQTTALAGSGGSNPLRARGRMAGRAAAQAVGAARPTSRVRPGDPAWPSEASWEELRRTVGGPLVKVQSPLADCQAAPASPRCAQVFQALKNPYLNRAGISGGSNS